MSDAIEVRVGLATPKPHPHFVFAEIGDAQEKIHVGIVRIVGEHLFETLD